MDNVVTVKPGVLFTVIAPAGFRLLEAITATARELVSLRITSACDGQHSGLTDPHKLGEAYDVGSHEFDAATKAAILLAFQEKLEPEHFYCFLESPNTENEHFHLQRAKGTTYP